MIYTLEIQSDDRLDKTFVPVVAQTTFLKTIYKYLSANISGSCVTGFHFLGGAKACVCVFTFLFLFLQMLGFSYFQIFALLVPSTVTLSGVT